MNCDNEPISTNLLDKCRLYFGYNEKILNSCILCNNQGIFNPNSYFELDNFTIPGPCIDFLNSVNPSNTIDYLNIRNYMNNFYEEFERRNCKIGDDNTSLNYSLIQPTLYYVCSNYGGFCDYGLKNENEELTYKGYCPSFDKNDLSESNKNLSYFCGCHLNNDQYLTGYDFSCDSICLSNQSIKRYTDSNLRIACTQPICIISNITVNVYESNGTLNFSQMCGSSCVGNSCSICIMQDVSINDVESLMDVNFLNACGNSSSDDLKGFLCYETINGVIEEVECEYENTDNTDEDNWKLIIIISAVIIISIIVIGLIILIIIQIKKSNESKYISE